MTAKNQVGRPPKDGETRESNIHIRTGRDRKSAYVRAAKPGTLSEWALKILDRESGYNPAQK